MNEEIKNVNELRVGFISSFLLALLTVIGFGFAMIAIPPAGPYCPGNCMKYPYVDLLKYYPRDYLWMYIVSFQLIAFLIFVIANHFNTVKTKRIYSFISVSLAIITTTILLANYFIQYSVVPISMVKGQSEGISLLTQYNGHGIFIVLEELGFILMSFVFFSLSLTIIGKSKLEKTLKWIYTIPVFLILISFIYCTVRYGLDRDYRFEVAVITIDWFSTIAIGIFSSIYFLREIKKI